MKQPKRSPKYLGTGIYVFYQFTPEALVKGDTFFDADYGMMRWTGKKWKKSPQPVPNQSSIHFTFNII